MDGTDQIGRITTIPFANTISCNGSIEADDGSYRYSLYGAEVAGTLHGSCNLINASGLTTLELNRDTGGLFDSTQFNDTTRDRGWFEIKYMP